MQTAGHFRGLKDSVADVLRCISFSSGDAGTRLLKRRTSREEEEKRAVLGQLG